MLDVLYNAVRVRIYTPEPMVVVVEFTLFKHNCVELPTKVIIVVDEPPTLLKVILLPTFDADIQGKVIVNAVDDGIIE